MFESRARPDATPELVQKALEFSHEVSELLDLHHPSTVPVGVPQTAVAAAMFSLSLDHRQSILLLVLHGARSSAAALLRPAFEAYFRGLWAFKVASATDISALLAAHPRGPKIDTMVKQLKKHPSTATLASFDAWRDAGDYVHGGPLQLQRWLGPTGIGPQHSDREIVELLEAVDLCGLLASIGLSELCGREEPPQALVDKMTELTMQKVARRAVAAYRGPEAAAGPESRHAGTPG